MSEGSNQPQRYCTNCGAEIREGTSFCASCGTPLAAGAQEPPPPQPEPSPTEEPSPFDNLLLRLRGIFDRAREGLATVDTGGIRRLPGRGMERFGQLSTIPQVAIIGLVVLVLMMLLVSSAGARIVCGGLFWVSTIVLVIRVVQRRPYRIWAIVFMVSVLLVAQNGGIGIPDAILHGGNSGGSGGGSGSADEANADALLSMLTAPMVGMPGGKDTIVDVRVDGRKATVIVSGASDEYAMGVCRYTLRAAREDWAMESASNDYAGITEVSVKRPWRPWSAASCSSY